MKATLFTLYVSGILLFSAFARAEMAMPFVKGVSGQQSMVQIDDVLIDDANLDLKISGMLPNPCTQNPIATMEQNDESPGTLVLRLSSPTHTGICVVPTRAFLTIVNLPVVAQNSNVQIAANQVYLVKVGGSEVEFEVPGIDLLRVPGFMAQ